MRMDLVTFCGVVLSKLDEFLAVDSIRPSCEDEDYAPGDWTALWNCVVAAAIHEYNQVEGTAYAVCFEPVVGGTPSGRGGYSDFQLCDEHGALIVVEHENAPYRRLQLMHNIHKLTQSKASSKLLITYWFDDFGREEMLDKISRVLQTERKLTPFYVLLAPDDITAADEYELWRFHDGKRDRLTMTLQPPTPIAYTTGKINVSQEELWQHQVYAHTVAARELRRALAFKHESTISTHDLATTLATLKKLPKKSIKREELVAQLPYSSDCVEDILNRLALLGEITIENQLITVHT